MSDFKKYQAQTTPHPINISIARASGCTIHTTDGKQLLDMVAGVSACHVGHAHPAVVGAVQQQAADYMHVMVYGETAQQKPIELSKLLVENSPDHIQSCYLVNSGTEAIDASMKLARVVTARSEILAAHNCYHGNTYGALSLMTYEERKAPFRPTLPHIGHIRFNCIQDLDKITERTAAVVLETIQGGAGFIEPIPGWLGMVRSRCNAMGALLILDEIQPGLGRTGTFWAFEHYGAAPDMIVTGKGLGGGMPIGALLASREHMSAISERVPLGHITTFGGNAVIAAAGVATLGVLFQENLMHRVAGLELRFRESVHRHNTIYGARLEVRGRGLMLALLLPDAGKTADIVMDCLDQGVLFFFLLFEKRAIRVTPPLTISEDEFQYGTNLLLRMTQNHLRHDN